MVIEVQKLDYDFEQGALRVSGVNIRENENIRMGQQHTIELEKGRQFKIYKSEWDSIHFDLLEELKQPMKTADIAAIAMQEGLAHLCLIRSSMTQTCDVIERTMPKKKQGNDSYEKAKNKYFSDIYTAVALHFNVDVLKVILIGSPGFLADEFITYMCERSLREEHSGVSIRPGLDNNQKLHRARALFVKAKASTGHRHAIEEMLGDEGLASRLENVRAAEDVSNISFMLSGFLLV